METAIDPPWEFGILLPEDRPFAGHPEFASGILLETGGSYPSETESTAVAQALGYAPQTEITLSSGRNEARDHHVLAWLAAEAAERLGGVIDLEQVRLPGEIERAAVAAGQVIRVTWEEGFDPPHPGVRSCHAILAVPEFLRGWRKHRRFRLMK